MTAIDILDDAMIARAAAFMMFDLVASPLRAAHFRAARAIPTSAPTNPHCIVTHAARIRSPELCLRALEWSLAYANVRRARFLAAMYLPSPPGVGDCDPSRFSTLPADESGNPCARCNLPHDWRGEETIMITAARIKWCDGIHFAIQRGARGAGDLAAECARMQWPAGCEIAREMVRGNADLSIANRILDGAIASRWERGIWLASEYFRADGARIDSRDQEFIRAAKQAFRQRWMEGCELIIAHFKPIFPPNKWRKLKRRMAKRVANVGWDEGRAICASQ